MPGIPLFDAKTAPIKGQRSSIEPTALEIGFWSKLENLVGARYSIYKRFGAAKLGSAPEADASFRGGWIGYIDGTLTCVCAFTTGSPATAVKIWQLNLSSYAWTERTTAGTRFSTIAFVDFAAGHDPGNVLVTNGADILVCSNGTDTPLAFRSVSGTLTPSTLSAISFPTYFLPTAQPWPECWFQIQDPANTTYVTTSGCFTSAADTGSAGENEIGVTVDTSTSGTLEIAISSASQLGAADYDVTTSSGSFDLSTSNGKSPYVGILFEDTIADPVTNYLSIELWDGSSYKFVYDLTQSEKSEPVLLPAAIGVYLAVFDLNLYRNDLANYINMERIRFTLDHAFPSGRSFKIIGIYGMGAIPPGAQHVVAYQNTTSLLESPGVVAKKLTGPQPRDVGGNKNRNFGLPEGAAGQNLGWTYIIPHSKPTTGNQTIFYRKDTLSSVADEYYFHTGVYQTTGTDAFGAKHDRVEVASKVYSRRAPSPRNQPPPKALALETSGGRLYAGGVSGQTGQLWISDRDYPLRFTAIPRDDDFDGQVDPDSGVIASFPSEKIVALKSMPGSVAGIGPVLVFTNQAMWRVEAFDAISLSAPTRLNANGTIYRFTPAIHKGKVYYLDAEKKPRVYTGGSESYPLGIWKVEDQFENGDCWNCHGYVFNEQYSIGLRAPSGTLKKKVIYYEEQTGEWWTHLYTTPDFAWNFVQQVQGTDGGSFSTAHGSKLIGITDAGVVYQVQQPGKLVDDKPTSGTEEVSITMETYVKGDGWGLWQFGKPGVIWEKSTGGSLTCTLTPLHDTTDVGGVYTGTIDLETGVASEAWRYFMSASPESAHLGIDSYACKISITGNPTSGKFCRGIRLAEVISQESEGAGN